MSMQAAALLAGPRGRHLCLAVAERLHQPVRSAWLEAARHPFDLDRRSALVQLLRQVDPSLLASWTDPLALVGPMDESVSSAMGWQPPHDEDVVAALPDVAEALRPIAGAIAAAPAAAWWDEAVDLGALRHTSRYDERFPATPPQLRGAADRLAAWRTGQIEDDRRAAAERPDDPAAAWSGIWWSTPAGSAVPVTTRSLPGLGSIALVWEEDSFGFRDAMVRPLRVMRAPRVFEINGPEAWETLTRRYPLDVSHSRRQDWYSVTGRDGRWLIPDWSAVAADWDAAHLTVAGYLETATRLLQVDADAATLLAGWSPDETWWLADVLEQDADEPEHWNDPNESGGDTWHWGGRGSERAGAPDHADRQGAQSSRPARAPGSPIHGCWSRGMFLIIGSRPVLTVLSVVTFVCPHCGHEARQRVVRQQQKLTVFFLPLLSLGSSWFVECGHCGIATGLTKQQAEHAQQWAASQGASRSGVR